MSWTKDSRYRSRREIEEPVFRNELIDHPTGSLAIQHEPITTNFVPYPTYPTGYKKLQELLKKDSNDLLLSLLCPHLGFFQRLSTDRSYKSIVPLVLKVITKACQAQQTEGHLLKFLRFVVDSCFMNQVVKEYLMQFINIGSTKTPDPELIRNCLLIFEALIKRLPTKSRSVINNFTILIDAVMLSQIVDCKSVKSISIMIAEIKQSLADISRNDVLGYLINDPNEEVGQWKNGEEFRRMSVVPTCKDLLRTANPRLNKVKLSGAYYGVCEYLDVQFRLLREDLVRPLRKGLSDLCDTKGRKSNLKVYREVRIVAPKFGIQGVIHRINFDLTHRLNKINWESSKRLNFGSLVCLSADKF